MENKYYIPSIEDIHVGYECEVYGQTTTKLIKNVAFHKVVVGLHMEVGKKVGINQIPNLLKKGYIKAPYLTKEQIEAEGWENYNSKLKPLCFKKDDYHLYFYEEDYTITIGKGTPPMWLNYYYNGKCPSINELRKIEKLLGIVK